MTLPTFELLIDLVTETGADVPGIETSVDLVDASDLIETDFGGTSRTIIPSTLRRTTDAQGRAIFELLPSSVVGLYRVKLGGFQRIISMPDRDANLSELPEA